MNYEIEEIKYWLEGLDDFSFEKSLDYITNLHQEIRQLRDELLKYELQNIKLQEELVRLKVTFGKSVYYKAKENKYE